MLLGEERLLEDLEKGIIKYYYFIIDNNKNYGGF